MSEWFSYFSCEYITIYVFCILIGITLCFWYPVSSSNLMQEEVTGAPIASRYLRKNPIYFTGHLLFSLASFKFCLFSVNLGISRVGIHIVYFVKEKEKNNTTWAASWTTETKTVSIIINFWLVFLHFWSQ